MLEAPDPGVRPTTIRPMRELDPLALRDTLKETVGRYLATAVPISPFRAPALAAALERALAKEPLVRGPFLESLPDFEKGGAMADLVDDGTLHARWRVMAERGFEGVLRRPLHRHQERAIRLATERGDSVRNFLVATGTGSGKTECFLIPLIDRLLREGVAGKPGVRAILVYPMNALANDQLFYRIAPLLLRQLGDPGITFGRFTGQVGVDSKRDAEESALLRSRSLREALGLGADGRIAPSWRLTRQEMLESPPHLLVTNYAMLEHLLLLPRNAPLFAGADLRFVILDEVHTYAGAQAIEVAFLLRKLKVRLGVAPGQVQCVGTSASLDPARGAELLRFASRLFGEPVEEVVSGERAVHAALGIPATVPSQPPAFWGRAIAALAVVEALDDAPAAATTGGDGGEGRAVAAWNAACQAHDVARLALPTDATSWSRSLLDHLRTFDDVQRLARLLHERKGVAPFEILARDLYPDHDDDVRLRALQALVALGVRARRSRDDAPLFPARYHLALRAIDGGVVRLDATAPERWSDLRLAASHRDPDDVPYYRVLSCRNCGEPYLEGWRSDDGAVMHAHPRPNARERLVLRLAGDAARAALEEVDGESDEDGDNGDGGGDGAGDADTGAEVLYVAPGSGRLGERAAAGLVQLTAVALVEDDDEGKRYLTRCVSCGTHARRYPEPISPLTAGDEALSAVATQVVLEALPPAGRADDGGDAAEHVMLHGRRLMAFSDNRQDAAFFAPFFERTSLDQALRHAIVRTLERARADDDGDVDFAALSDDVVKTMTRAQGSTLVFHEKGIDAPLPRKQVRARILNLVAAEFCSPGLRRLSLEGLGLVQVGYARRAFAPVVDAVRAAAPPALAPYAEAFVRFVLDTMRRDRCIDNLDDALDLDDDAVWPERFPGERRGYALHALPKEKPRPRTLVPSRDTTHNRFTALLERRLGLDRAASTRVLTAFWESARVDGRLLVHTGDRKHFLLQARTCQPFVPSQGTWYRCGTCGAIAPYTIGDACLLFRCEGRVTPLPPTFAAERQQRHHYVATYTRDAPPAYAIAREHTASIADDDRVRFEGAFREGRINVLSCTTTMELGVDLGELEGIVCRNVPPSIANYQQRAGRAGRRSQSAPVAVTVARNGRFDQWWSRHFDQYLTANVPVPYLTLDNPDFFRRHQVSIVLSHYLRETIPDLKKAGSPSLRDVFGEQLTEEQVEGLRQRVAQWLESSGGRAAIAEGERYGDTLPGEHRSVALRGRELEEHFKDRFLRHLVGGFVASTWQGLHERRVAARAEENDTAAAAIERQQERLLQLRLVNVLSREAVIPTYAFPVHTISLEVVQRRGQGGHAFKQDDEVRLDRDATLGVREYAPGAQVVAAGRVWESVGIVRSAKEFMPMRAYQCCRECRHVMIRDTRDELPPSCTHCDEAIASHERRLFIEPRTFLTSLNDKGKDPGTTRIKERVLEEARLVTHAPPSEYADTDVPQVRTFFASASGVERDRGASDGTHERMRGQLFVVNQGARKNGYRRCKRCEYTEAARQGALGHAPWKTAHRNPRTGEACACRESMMRVDLGHVFATDVRAFRFSRLLPVVTDGAGEVGLEAAARTLAESLRVAAVQLLEASDRDIRATYELRDGRATVVLYDQVAGGAGFVRRVGAEGSAATTRLLQQAVQVLTCECERSCGRCLQDYANQAWWDDFDRGPVLGWLQEVLAAQVTSAGVAPAQATHWPTPSQGELRTQLQGATEVHLLASGLLGSADVDGDRALAVARWVRDLLEDDPGRTVTLHLQQGVPLRVGEVTSASMAAVALLATLEKEGRLFVRRRSAGSAGTLTPRIVAMVHGSAQAWYVDDAERPLLDGIVLPVTFRAVFDRIEFAGGSGAPTAAGAGRARQAGTTERRSADVLQLPASEECDRALRGVLDDTKRFDFTPAPRAGERRPSGAFDILEGATIAELSIADPYLLRLKEDAQGAVSPGNVTSAARFLRLLFELTGRPIGRVRLRWKPERTPPNARQQEERALQEALRGESLDGLTIDLAPAAPWSGHFHDRWVQASGVGRDGQAFRYRWDVTAGIDSLMRADKECAVFRTALE